MPDQSFDAERIYLKTIEFMPDDNIESLALLLLEDARSVLPPGTRFVVVDAGKGDFGRTRTAAWLYEPDLPVNPEPEEWKRKRGSELFGEFIA